MLSTLLTSLLTSLVAFAQLTSLDGTWEVRPLDATDEAFRAIQVPASFEEALGVEYDGRAEYRRTLELSTIPDGARAFIHFDAVMTEASVYVGDRELGQHLGGWTPFRVEIPADLIAEGGDQVLRVVVDEKVGHSLQGFLPAVQPHFGGIWKPVRLEVANPALFDRDNCLVVGELRGEERYLRWDLNVIGDTQGLRIEFDAPRGVGQGYEIELSSSGAQGEDLLFHNHDNPPALWSPDSPVTHTVELDLFRGDELLDHMEARILFGAVTVDERLMRWNGRPLHVRGMLHWGYEPPTLAPFHDTDYWRVEMRAIKALGFNLIKACLWLPPRAFFEAAALEGLFVWLEYPSWHPDFSKENLPLLLAEYEEFFAYDRGEAHILARSLTCETGQAGADIEVVQGLYDLCKEKTGARLVEDDSSWISWNRVHDFYDDHPYGNASDWLARLDGFDRHIEEHGEKPFLLGEAIAGDTWPDISALDEAGEAWWRPFVFEDMQAFEEEVALSMGEGAKLALRPDSMTFARKQRKYQMEAFRRRLPRAGYVSSVFRDIRQCQMGFFDDFGVSKFSAEDFAWHGDFQLVLHDAGPLRSVQAGDPLPSLRIAGPIEQLPKEVRCVAELTTSSWTPSAGYEAPVSCRAIMTLHPRVGQALLGAVFPTGLGAVPGGPALSRLDLTVEIEGVARNSWTFFRCAEPITLPEGLRETRDVIPDDLDWVESGGQLLIHAGGRGAPSSAGLWFLQGAPYAPTDSALFDRVPRDFLFELFDLDFSGEPFLETPLSTAFGNELAFWDSHDEKERVQRRPCLLVAGAGEGRILATSLNLGEEGKRTPAQAWLRAQLAAYLVEVEPTRDLSPELIASWKSALTVQRLPLDGVWKLQSDAEDKGRRGEWAAPDFDDSGWIDSRAGIHWESAGLPHYTGTAWYRKRVVLPPNFEGVDDSYDLFVNGEWVATFGDPETGETVWLVRTQAEISSHLHPGENLIALRVVDHTGAGGLHRPAYLCLGDPALEDWIGK